MGNLAEIMERGFATLQSSLSQMNSNVCSMNETLMANMCDEDSNSETDERVNNDDLVNQHPDSLDVYDAVSSTLTTSEALGNKINDKLAKVVDTLMSEKPNEETILARQKKYLRPENCEFLQVPKMNSELWNSIPIQSRNADLSLQNIQAKLLLELGQL